MVDRLEFTKKVKTAIFKRAGGPGDPRCENKQCGFSVKNKPFEIDHIIEEWEREDVARGLRAPLSAADGQLLCIACHNIKKGKKNGERAHCTRIIEKAAKAKTKRPGGFQKRYKKCVNGDVIDRETGEVVKRGYNG
jgi:hypothetical protein